MSPPTLLLLLATVLFLGILAYDLSLKETTITGFATSPQSTELELQEALEKDAMIKKATEDVGVLSEDLKNTNSNYRFILSASERSKALSSMINKSKERKSLILSLMENDTATALRVASLASSRNLHDTAR